MSTTPTLLWIGCGSCSGESMAILGVDGQATDFLDLLDKDGLRLLWHPSLSLEPLAPIVDGIEQCSEPVDEPRRGGVSGRTFPRMILKSEVF